MSGPVRLGLRENAAQFSLLVGLNALVGAMVGLERSVLPLVGERDFGLASKGAILSFVVAFGLAKAFHEESASADSVDLSQSPTTIRDRTRAGAIMGTAAFMSPEQAKGKAVDKRADIWAFGCVLYEALTGRRAFAGETAAEILANVLKSEPDWDRLPAQLPGGVRKILERCLTKDRSRRLRDIGEAWVILDETKDALEVFWNALGDPLDIFRCAPTGQRESLTVQSCATCASCPAVPQRHRLLPFGAPP